MWDDSETCSWSKRSQLDAHSISGLPLIHASNLLVHFSRIHQCLVCICWFYVLFTSYIICPILIKKGLLKIEFLSDKKQWLNFILDLLIVFF